MEDLISFVINHKESVISFFTVIFALFVLGACLDKWNEIWYDFGQNLYYMLHS